MSPITSNIEILKNKLISMCINKTIASYNDVFYSNKGETLVCILTQI